MSRYPDTVILVFAKAPVAGQVNTRLIPDLGIAEATSLQDELIHRRLSSLSEASLCDVVLYCSPDISHVTFRACAQEYGVSLASQEGEGLGQRLRNGLDQAIARYDHAILLGTDAPALESGQIDEAIQCLHAGKDAVFVPAEDGGYVLAGMNGTYHELFSGIDWGTDAVMQQTTDKLEQSGLDYQLLDPCWDIDRYEDFQRYLKQFKTRFRR